MFWLVVNFVEMCWIGWNEVFWLVGCVWTLNAREIRKSQKWMIYNELIWLYNNNVHIITIISQFNMLQCLSNCQLSDIRQIFGCLPLANVRP